MREIEFRAWDKKSKKIRAVNSISFNYENESFNFNHDRLPKVVNCWGYDCIEGKHIIIHREMKEVILMQYTGLKDKNGKEIYEGDICFCNYGTGEYGVVKYIDGCFFLCDLHSDNQDFPIYDLIKDDNGNIKSEEIIGNIYENPELLK